MRLNNSRPCLPPLLPPATPPPSLLKKAMGVMQSLVVDLFDQLAGEAGHLTSVNKRKTLTAREVQASGRGAGAAVGMHG